MRLVARLLAATAACGALVLGGLPAVADDGAASGEAPPPAVEAAPSTRAAAAAGATTTYVDDEGRTVFRVDDGFDLDQYLYQGELSFSFDIDENYGPVDEHGHPAPGNTLYGKQMLLTLRAWDVDEVQGELDEVRFNGSKLVPGELSGSDNQWATDTFDVWASWLRLPTADNPRGTNTVTVDVDVNAGGWAVEVDWAELRPLVEHDAVRPVVLAHGITDNDSGSGRSGMWEFEDYLSDIVPELGGRTSSPQLTQHGSLATNARLLGEEIDELVEGEPTDQVDIVAHSMGGLGGRLYAFTHPGRVRNLVMVGTPNHGSELATSLCLLRGMGLGSVAPEFGECNSADDGLLQLVPAYVEKFNEVVTDLPSVNYRTVAGRGGGPGSLLTGGVGPGILGEDDGTVSVESVRWLSVGDPDHPGRHFSEYPTVDRDHMGLIHSNASGEQPLSYAMAACIVAYDALSFCPLPVDLDGTETTDEVGAASRAVPAVADVVQDGVGPAGPVGPGATMTFPIEVVDGETAGLQVLADDSLQLSLSGGTLEDTEVLGVAAQGADLDGPATLTVHNPTGTSLSFGSILRLVSERTLALTAPSHVAEGDAVTVDVSMTAASSDEEITYTVTDGAGTTVAEGLLPSTDGATWSTEVPVGAPGTYTVRVVTAGERARAALSVVSVLGGAAFPGGFGESTTDPDGDGLADTLVVDVPVAVDADGDYQLSVRVLDSAGRTVTAGGGQARLSEGTGSIAVELDGRDIHDSDLDGPWTLSVVLSDSDLDILARTDLGSITHDDRRAYEHDALEMTGFTDEPLDVDADGLIDTLRVTGGVRAEVSGTYEVNGKLVAGDGSEVARASSTVSLSAGTTPVALDFDGGTIGATGEDGPFILRDLTLYPSSDPSGGIALVDAYRTGPYRSAQFPGGTAGDLPPTAAFDVVGVDGTQVVLDASASTDDHGIVSYDWELGDGTTATGSRVTHRYAAPGTYAVTLTVTDAGGRTANAVSTVVAAPPTCDGRVPTIVGDGRGTILGTNGDDVILGTSADERIDGGPGDDVICGGGGDDVLVGSNGSDRLIGLAGQDRLDGGDGDDYLDGGAGDDTVVGANGRDTLVGAAGRDHLDGGDGDDLISGGDGDDTVIGANGRDTIDAGAGADTVSAGEGDDTVDAGDGDDVVLAGGNDDIVRAGAGDDRVEGGEGRDRIWGEDGDDVLLGQGGDDEIDGGAGTDVIDGGNGRNTIRDVP